MTQANLLLKQIVENLNTMYVLIPNQHIGVYKVGYNTQKIAREYLVRHDSRKFQEGKLIKSRCSLLGYCPSEMNIDGFSIPQTFLQVNLQPEVGEKAYQKGASVLVEFFKKELQKYLTKELLPLGREIIEACLNDASVERYEELIEKAIKPQKENI